MGEQLPIFFRLLWQAGDGLARRDQAEVFAIGVEGGEIMMKDRADRISMQHAEVVGLQKSIHHELPVHLAGEIARSVVLESSQSITGQFTVELAEPVRDLEITSRSWADPQHTVPLGRG